MPSKKPLFKPEVEEVLVNFLQNHDRYIQGLISSADDPENRRHHQKLKNYSHNIILRRADLETTTRCFGSRVFGTSSPLSNLNIYVETDNHDNTSDKNHAIDVLEQVKGTMERTVLWKIKTLVRDTPVPFLRVIFRPLKMQLDFIASSPIALHDTKIFDHFMDLQPEARGLFHFIRKWININDIPIKNMILFYLVVFYLQRERALPTLKEVHSGVKKEMIKGWEVQFDENRTIASYNIDDMDYYENYVVHFFQFYSSINFAETVIDMHSGKLIPRRDYNIKGFELNSHMCVAAPLDRNRNVARLVGKDTLAKFKKICGNSAVFLKQNSYLLYKNEE